MCGGVLGATLPQRFSSAPTLLPLPTLLRPGVWGVFPTLAMPCDTTWVSCNQFHPGTNQSQCRPHSLRAQSQETAPSFQMPVASHEAPVTLFDFCPTWLPFKVPVTSLLGSPQVLEQLTEPRGALLMSGGLSHDRGHGQGCR